MIRPTVRRELFDCWALLAVHAARAAALRATVEQVRSLAVIGRELELQADAQIWESIADAWRTGVFEACGDHAADSARSALDGTDLWESLTSGVDLPAELWEMREPLNRTAEIVIAAVSQCAPDAAADGMRAHVEAVRAVLFNDQGAQCDRRVGP